MSFIIEDKPVNAPSLVEQAAALLPTLKVGQSFLVPIDIGNRLRKRHVPDMQFKVRTEGNLMRIGRVA